MNFFKTMKQHKLSMFIIIIVGLLAHYLATFISSGHPTDMNCFASWADKLYEFGPWNFYTSEGFTDYPPGYMYILLFMGFLRQSVIFLSFGTPEHHLLLKTPAILAGVLSGIFIFYIAKPKLGGKKALFCAMAYVLNPVIILNSAVWGQVDSIHTLIIAISIYYLINKKLFRSSIIFVIAALVKPQSLMVSPVYIFAFFEYLRHEKWSLHAFLTLLKYAVACALAAIALMLPFASYSDGFPDFSPIISQYIQTLASYNYATVNAYNIYALLGFNWVALDTVFLGLAFSTWGYITIISIVIASLFLLFRNKTESNYFYTAAFIVICTFMLSVKMHERYCFPALLFFIIAYAYRPNTFIAIIFSMFSVTMFLQNADVFAMSVNDYNYPQIETTIIIFSFLMTVAFLVMLVLTFFIYKKGSIDEKSTPAIFNKIKEQLTAAKNAPKPDFTPSAPEIRYQKRDFIFLAVITLIYAITAFSKLGDMTAPQKPWVAEDGDFCIIDLGSVYSLSRVQYMTNAKHDMKFSFSFSTDGTVFGNSINIENTSVFNWDEVPVNKDARYVMVTSQTSEFRMNEIAVRDHLGNILGATIKSGTDGAGHLLDEQQYVPLKRDYMNSAYFDEIYHPRTAYEFLNGLKVYEWTHPQLGKLIMSVGIMIFGMVPFGWRFMGTLFGVLMVPVIFFFARRMFKQFRWAALATIIFTFDFMHYTQTRLATIDTYITIFVMLMYYFMYKYCQLNYNDPNTKFKKTLIPLGLSGIFMGIGIASKWPGMYAGMGLAILFFIHIGKRVAEYLRAMDNPAQENEHIRYNFREYTGRTFLFCLVFFIVVPATIYLCSYIPYYFGNHGLYPERSNIGFFVSNPDLALQWPDNQFFNFVAAVVQNQFDMYNYHSKLESTHAFSSSWWEWILNIRPIFYFSNNITINLKQGISAFGNPAVWWLGIIAFFYAIYSAYVRKSRDAVFLILAYLAQLMPWVLVSRTTYIYHYFPSVPFLVLLISHAFRELIPSYRFKMMLPAYVYAVVVILLFIMFYPVLTGIPVSVWYVENILKWLPRWQFIY